MSKARLFRKPKDKHDHPVTKAAAAMAEHTSLADLSREVRKRTCFSCREATVADSDAAKEAGWTFFRPGIVVCASCWPAVQLDLWRGRKKTVQSLRAIAKWLEDLSRDEINEDSARWVHYTDELAAKLASEIEGVL